MVGLRALVVAGLIGASIWTVYTQYVVLPMTDHVTSRTFRDQSIEQYEQILNGTRPFPYQWRVAGPHLVKWFSTATGRDPHQIDVGLKAIALAASAWFVLRFATRWLSPIGVLATAALYFLMTAAGYSSEGYSIYYTNDFLMVMGWNAAIAFMASGQWAVVAVVIFLTAWAKETVFLLALLAFATWWRCRATLLQAAYCGLAFAIPTVILRALYPAPLGEWAWWHNLGLNLASPGDVVKLVVFFNVWGVLAIQAWRSSADPFLRDLGWLVMVYVAIMFVVIDLRELRHFMPLLIIVLPAAVSELERRFAGVRAGRPASSS